MYVGAGGVWGDVMSYDDRSNLVWRTDARGVRTHFAYNNDPLNRLQSVSYDTSGFGDTSHPVSPAAPVTYEYRERPNETTYVDVTQVRRVTASGVSTEEYGFDAIGRTIDKTLTLTSRAAYPQRTDYVYDSLDRVTDVRYPAQYRTGQVSPARKLVHHGYDVASRLNRVQVDGADYASSLDYNAASQTTSLSVGSGGNQVGERYDYDSLTGLLTGQRVERTGGGTRLLDLTYDYVRAGTPSGRTGQLTKITNHRDRNKDRGYQYDALGRLRRVIAGQQSHWVQAYDYDRFGNRTRVLQTTGTEQYVANFYTVALGRQPAPDELQAWANNLRQAFVSGEQGQVWEQVLVEAQALGSEVFNSAEYAARGRTDEQFVNDLYRAFLLREPEAEGVVDWLEYLGVNGRAQTVTQFSAGDELDLIASSLVPTERVSPAQVPRDGRDRVSYEYASNRINLPGWEYDASGNQTRMQSVWGAWQRMEYDAAGRLVRVMDDSQSYALATYTYGASNARLMTDEPGLRTYYAWSGSGVIAEYTESDISPTSPQWSKTYIYLGARLLATQTPTGGEAEYVEYHHPDRLGTRIVTNSSDTNFYEQTTLPYGVALDAESTGATNRRFTSYDRSATTGLDYAVNRHYDSSQGRFTQVDPIEMSAASLSDPQSLNMYSYVGNDPVNFTDPSGLFFGKLFRAIGKIFKAIAIAVAVALVVIAIITAPQVTAGITAWLLVGAGAAVGTAYGPPWLQRVISGVRQFGFGRGFSAGPGGTAVFNPNAGSGLGTGVGAVNNYIYNWQDGVEVGGCGSYSNPCDLGTVTATATRPWYRRLGAWAWENKYEIAFEVGITFIPPARVASLVFRGASWGLRAARIARLTRAERRAIQSVANRYNTTIDVVGSRATGRGRNIFTDLPVGKGRGTRSDIDVRIDADLEIFTGGRITDDLMNIGGGGLVNVRPRLPGGSYSPVIQIRPKP